MHRPFSKPIQAVAAALVLALLASPGCFRAGELSGICREFESQLPGSRFEKDVELSFGPLLLSFARLLTSVIPGAGEARPWLSGISRVQVGVYAAHIDSLTGLRTPERLASLLDDGWETAVRTREEHEAVWILYRPDGDRVREVFVVVLTEEELVLVKARGNMEKLIAAALNEARGRESFLHEFGS